jgi:hypothetical protein
MTTLAGKLMPVLRVEVATNTNKVPYLNPYNK